MLSVADIQSARRVLPDQEAWLIPFPQGLCLVRVIYPLVHQENGKNLPPAVSRLCSSSAEAEAGRLFETQSLSTTMAKRLPTRVDGIVPDDVDHVVVRFDGEATKRVAVKRNAYEVVVTNPRFLWFVAQRHGRRQRYTIALPSVAGGSSASNHP